MQPVHAFLRGNGRDGIMGWPTSPRIEELRNAFMAMVKDPDFLAEVAKLNFDLDVLSGADLQDFFVKAEYAPALIDKAKAVAKLAEH